MKNLILIVAMLTSLNVMSKVECAKEGRFYYPVNAKAIKIATTLKVKTCNGKRFKAVVAAIGETSNVPATIKHLTMDELIKSMKK